MLVRPCDHIIIIMILPTSLPSSLTYTLPLGAQLRSDTPAHIGHLCYEWLAQIGHTCAGWLAQIRRIYAGWRSQLALQEAV